MSKIITLKTICYIFVLVLLNIGCSKNVDIDRRVQEKVWDKTFGGTSDDQLYSMIATSDGGFLLAGDSSSGQNGNKAAPNRGGNDYWVVKVDENGNKVWDKTFGGFSSDELSSMIATSDGAVLLGGDSRSGQNGNKSAPNIGTNDYWVVKIDGSGNLVWDKTFGGTDGDFLSSMISTSDGGALLGGYSRSGQSGNKSASNQVKSGSSTEGEDYWVVKIDGNGNKVWDKTFGGSDSDNLSSIIATSDGGFLLGGNSTSGQNGNKSAPKLSNGRNTDYWVVKIDGSGNKVWDKTFGGTAINKLSSMITTSDGGFLLGGSSMSDQDGNKSAPNRGTVINDDYWVVKIDGSGNKVWDQTFGGTDFDDLSSMIATSDGGFLLGGYSRSAQNGNKSTPNKGSADYWVVKIDRRGNIVWDQTFGGTGFDRLHSMIAISGGGFLLGGYSDSGQGDDKSDSKRGEDDYWVVKIK